MPPSLHRAADSLDLAHPHPHPHPRDSPTRSQHEPSGLAYALEHFTVYVRPVEEDKGRRQSGEGSERSFDGDLYAPEGDSRSSTSNESSDHPCPQHLPPAPTPFFRPNPHPPSLHPHSLPPPQPHLHSAHPGFHYHPGSTAALVAAGSIGMGFGPYATREAAMGWRGPAGQGHAGAGKGEGEGGRWMMGTDALEEEPDYGDENVEGWGCGGEKGRSWRGERQGVGLPGLPQVAYTTSHLQPSQEALLPTSPQKPPFHSPHLHPLPLITTKRNPSPSDPSSFTLRSLRGWLNASALVLLLAGLVTLFVGYPILQWARAAPLVRYGGPRGYGVGRNSTRGDVPGRGLVDPDTPGGVRERVGFDGEKYELVFSDEFNTPGRSFWPGDDPYWEAVELHYYSTNDLEYYHPDQVTTSNGSLVITIDQRESHGLQYVSGMLQGWNKFCYSGGGYVEVSVSLPGRSDVSGLWPSVWTMGNLARAGYGATSDGTWPYSYDTCDVGTLANQTYPNSPTPLAAVSSGSPSSNGSLSYQPGQRLSACSCPSTPLSTDQASSNLSAGGIHPGPSPSTGRGAPELDLLEAQSSLLNGALAGSVSQSARVAPFDAAYAPLNVSGGRVMHGEGTYVNGYLGGVYQEAVSAVTPTDAGGYELGGGGFASYGVESWGGGGEEGEGFVTWQVGGEETWTLNAAAVGPNPETEIGQRLITQEPMYLILNLALAESFQTIDYAHLAFPAQMRVDYVRVWQRAGQANVGCDPASHPTGAYIAQHEDAYMNPNLTTWAQAGYEAPKNSLVDQC